MIEPSVTVAAFNLHAGIDGYGRRFDVVAACAELAADVLILEEVFSPLTGASQAQEIADGLGLHCLELPLSSAWRIRQEIASAPPGEWEPRRPYPRTARALRVSRSAPRSDRYEEGSWGLAVLTREIPTSSEVIELGRLKRDFTARRALSLTLPSGIVVIGTHMAHFTHGSPVLLRRLASRLPDRKTPAVLGGDFNFWGPPIELLLPGWRRAVKAKTWPAGRPHHQLDHLFVTEAVRLLSGEAVRAGNSDHLPIRTELTFGALASSQPRVTNEGAAGSDTA